MYTTVAMRNLPIIAVIALVLLLALLAGRDDSSELDRWAFCAEAANVEAAPCW